MNIEFKEVDSETLALLQERTGGYPAPKQYGPVRFRDIPSRCVSRRCGSSTYIEVEGVRYCMMHAIRKLNEMLIGHGVGPLPDTEVPT